MIPLNQSYSITRDRALPVSNIPKFYEECGIYGFQAVELPARSLVERLTNFERATAGIVALDIHSAPPRNQVGEALVRLRQWQRDRGLHFYSVTRLARHLTQAQGARHPSSFRLAKHGWALLAALDAADLVRIELTAEDSRERVRLSARLADLGGGARLTTTA